MLAIGVLTTVITGLWGEWVLAAITGWGVASATYIAWVWLTIGRMDAATTSSHATREDPSRGVTDVLVLLASIGSLGAIVYLVIVSPDASKEHSAFVATLAVASIALSWGLVHTLYTLRYASQYYGDDEGGISFNQDEPPRYTDFAYLAFTIGMTFQVSDTNLETHPIRATALRHALMSYIYGTVILAMLINLIAGLPN